MTIQLPKFDAEIRRQPSGGLQIYDRLRAKYVSLTPEEWVRQHFVNYLCEYRSYPSTFMANEVGLTHNGVKRRCDTVVYDRGARPLAIVEYKASTISITSKVFDQIVRYNMVLNVRWLMVSNGLQSYCCRVTEDGKSYQFVKDIPLYETLLSGSVIK